MSPVSSILAVWSPDSFPEWLGTSATFAVLGLALLIVFVVLLDKIILHKTDIAGALEKNNIATAIFLGACVAAAAYIIAHGISM